MTFNQFTINLFFRLRQSGLPLTIGDYNLLLNALQKGLGTESKGDFLKTCQILWSKSLEQREIISIEFQNYYQETLTQILETIEEAKANSSINDLKAPLSSIKTDQLVNKYISDESGHNIEKNYQENNEPKNKETRYIQHDAPLVAFFSLKDAPPLGDALNTKLDTSNFSYIRSPFILTNDYLPVSPRHIQQSWRKISHYTFVSKNCKDIDWPKTTQKIAQYGFLIEPVYKKVKKNQIHLTVFIDHQGSMVPHFLLGQLLIEGAMRSEKFSYINVLYMKNIPSKYLYRNPNFTDIITVNKMLQSLPSQHNVFLFFSDAGASRGFFNPQRAIDTKRFITLLNKKGSSIAWINPMPKSRWSETTAEFIKLLVPMYECSGVGIDAAIKSLKTGNNARL